MHWEEGAPCWWLPTEHWAQGTAGCWEQAACSNAGKPKMVLQGHQEFPGGGVWRAVTIAGGSSSAHHTHGTTRKSCRAVSGGTWSGKVAHLPWGGFPCTVPVLQLGGEQGLRSISKGGIMRGLLPWKHS